MKLREEGWKEKIKRRLNATGEVPNEGRNISHVIILENLFVVRSFFIKAFKNVRLS